MSADGPPFKHQFNDGEIDLYCPVCGQWLHAYHFGDPSDQGEETSCTYCKTAFFLYFNLDKHELAVVMLDGVEAGWKFTGDGAALYGSADHPDPNACEHEWRSLPDSNLECKKCHCVVEHDYSYPHDDDGNSRCPAYQIEDHGFMDDPSQPGEKVLDVFCPRCNKLSLVRDELSGYSCACGYRSREATD